MEQAGIARKLTCLWNLVPFWDGKIGVSTAELEGGVRCLTGQFDIMPRLKVVVLVGKKAERAMPLLAERKYAVLTSFHPSPKVYAIAREKWETIPGQWAKVQEYSWNPQMAPTI